MKHPRFGFFRKKHYYLYFKENSKLSVLDGASTSPCCGTPNPDKSLEHQRDAPVQPVWAQGRRSGPGVPLPSRSLLATNDTHIRCGVIKKQMSQCRAVFRRLALRLQMADSHCAHQPPMHPHIRFRKPSTDEQTDTRSSLRWTPPRDGNKRNSWSASQPRWLHKYIQGGQGGCECGGQKMKKQLHLDTFTFVNNWCCLFSSFGLSQKNSSCFYTEGNPFLCLFIFLPGTLE